MSIIFDTLNFANSLSTFFLFFFDPWTFSFWYDSLNIYNFFFFMWKYLLNYLFCLTLHSIILSLNVFFNINSMFCFIYFPFDIQFICLLFRHF